MHLKLEFKPLIFGRMTSQLHVTLITRGAVLDTPCCARCEHTEQPRWPHESGIST